MGGQRHAPAALLPGKRPGTYVTGSLVRPRADMDGCGKSRPHRDPIPDRPFRSESLYRLRYEDKRPFVKPGRLWEGSIKTDLRWNGCDGMDCIHVVHNGYKWRDFVRTVMSLRLPWNEGNLLNSGGSIAFSSMYTPCGVHQLDCF